MHARPWHIRTRDKRGKGRHEGRGRDATCRTSRQGGLGTSKPSVPGPDHLRRHGATRNQPFRPSLHSPPNLHSPPLLHPHAPASLPCAPLWLLRTRTAPASKFRGGGGGGAPVPDGWELASIRSRPAEKCLPRAETTTARTSGSALAAAKVWQAQECKSGSRDQDEDDADE